MAQAVRKERQRLFYGVTELAALFDTSEWTIYTWARQGRIPVFRVGKRLRFPVAAVEAFIQRRTEAERPASTRRRAKAR
jgi:excisionase family DNA binding protein